MPSANGVASHEGGQDISDLNRVAAVLIWHITQAHTADFLSSSMNEECQQLQVETLKIGIEKGSWQSGDVNEFAPIAMRYLAKQSRHR
jgi:hypothetical protein